MCLLRSLLLNNPIRSIKGFGMLSSFSSAYAVSSIQQIGFGNIFHNVFGFRFLVFDYANQRRRKQWNQVQV